MAKQSKKPADLNRLAASIVRDATEHSSPAKAGRDRRKTKPSSKKR